MPARNLDTQQILAEDLAEARSFLARAWGLLGRSNLPRGAGLLIRPCRSIHTFGMRFPIDALFLNRDQQVVGLVHALKPQRISPIFVSAYGVIELPAGTLKATGTLTGHRVTLAADTGGTEPAASASTTLCSARRHCCTIPAACPEHEESERR
jgi:uncharacterized protein